MKFFEVNGVEFFDYKGRVYDLEVDIDHNYTINDFIVHNSAAGSLVSYVIGITDVDPLKHDLLFERFLDIARNDVVDIDTDFEQRVRDDVIDYIIEKFGRDYVSAIGTYGVLKLRSATLDVARVFKIPAQETLAITTIFPKDLDESASLEEIEYELAPKDKQGNKLDDSEFTKYLNRWEKEGYNLRYYIEGIRGGFRQASQHAAGVLISSEKLVENLSIIRAKKRIITAWQEGTGGHELSDLGYYKYDILGLVNLQVVNDASDLVKKRHKKEIAWHEVDLDDPFVFDSVINNGDHFGVFQFESNWVGRIIKNIHPDNFEELAQISALLRPGPLRMGMDEEYAARKNGKTINKKIDARGKISKEYLDWSKDEIPECIKDILEPSYGILCYQEQFMQIANKIGSLDKTETNAFRKQVVKIGKASQDSPEYKEIMNMYHGRFLEEASKPENLGDRFEAQKLWELIVSFASYGFNKCIYFKETVRDKDRGIITLEEVQSLKEKGENVWIKSADENQNEIWVEVTDVHDNGEKDLVEVEMENGVKIKCTLDHKFRTKEGMLPLEEIISRDLEIVSEEKSLRHI